MIHALYAVLWGATWGNNTAAAEWGAAGTLAGYACRHRIGAVLARWWYHHTAARLRDELGAVEGRLREHITAEIRAGRQHQDGR